MRLAKLATALLCGCLPAAGCVCQQGSTRQKPSPQARELAFYDFAKQPELPKTVLWPPGNGAPNRKKRQLLTRQDGADLLVTTDGPDPFLVWDFEAPERAGAFSVELLAEQPGQLQLFWANSDCKVYEERCSTRATFEPGKRVVEFLLDPAQVTRGLRLDFPETRGNKLRIQSIRIFERPRLSAGYEPRHDHTRAEATPSGLRLSCSTPDPWLVFSTPWLDTSKAESIEVELAGPPNIKPQLFWTGGSCPHFMEKCSVPLKPVGGTARFAARLAGLETWRGRANDLRLDPGEAAGDYTLKTLVFVRSGAKP